MTVLEDWVNLSPQTPLDAVRMNARDRLLLASLVQLARDPDALFAGAVTRNADGAATSAVVEWPDKVNGVAVSGTYSGIASTTFPGSINSYTITRNVTPTVTYTQPAVTRDASGYITNRPPITVT